ncbi:MAG: TPM domain-containing protein [Bacteroidia bacterium]|nr:TPM domain-containing protein [Bacteroidia bacterium]MCF8425965.1 TPM domain-containing protein [Bacteroidia bacterium]
MSKNYLSKEDQELIVSAIQSAELATSGEIRVHIEPTVSIDPMKRAQEVFFSLGMEKTEQKNGVLIYLAMEDRKLAIVGDEGIHQKVGSSFWEEEKELMKSHFLKGEFAIGLSSAIEKVGEKLRAYFPYQSDDVNELNNEISFGGSENE